MARSTMIYVVTDKNDTVQRGFTVKHELVSYLHRLGPEGRHWRTVLRLRDAGREDRGPTDSWTAEEYFTKES